MSITHPRVSVRAAFKPAYDAHVQTYAEFDCCDLCQLRTNRCLVRGQIPADVLYIGEGPGDSEDTTGFPFKGPAGNKLDEIIFAAERHALLRDESVSDEEYKALRDSGELLGLRHAFGNLVACIPLNEKRATRQPTKKEIVACQPRLLDLVILCQPRIIVLCGLLPQKHFPKDQVRPPHVTRLQEYVEIIHPSSILRSEDDDPQGAALAYKRTILALSAAFRVPF